MNHTSPKEQFIRCYEAEVDAVFRYCLIRVSNKDQAIDITQETFLRLWQTLNKGTEVLNPRAFLFTVAHRLIIDWYRKKKAVSIESVDNSENDDPHELFLGEDYLDLELKAEARYILDKLGQISSGNRQAVYLRFVEGLSPKEIGGILKISTNATSVRINRGLRELKAITGYD